MHRWALHVHREIHESHADLAGPNIVALDLRPGLVVKGATERAFKIAAHDEPDLGRFGSHLASLVDAGEVERRRWSGRGLWRGVRLCAAEEEGEREKGERAHRGTRDWGLGTRGNGYCPV